MLAEALETHFAQLIAGKMALPLRLAPGGIDTPDVIEMLGELAHNIGAGFRPASWLMIERGEVAGLLSIVQPPTADGMIEIGYGVAKSRRQRGIATRAVAELLRWANADPRVNAVTAETSVGNPVSQRVLTANGFTRVGSRTDAEEGDLICWRITTTGLTATSGAE